MEMELLTTYMTKDALIKYFHDNQCNELRYCAIILDAGKSLLTTSDEHYRTHIEKDDRFNVEIFTDHELYELRKQSRHTTLGNSDLSPL